MEISNILSKMQNIKEHILTFLEGEDEIAFTTLVSAFDEHLKKSPYEIKEFLYLISKISDHHNRKNNFIIKIEQILKQFKEIIKQNLTNLSIFNIFKKNKRILLFLFEDEYITINKYILSTFSKPKYFEMRYYEYFLPEILAYHKQDQINMNEYDKKAFNQKRKTGENDNYICTLIQNDSISDFIEYVNKTNCSLLSEIEPSIFETNKFLLQVKKCSLIEYAAFFGSIQIFKYLLLNKVDLTSALWIFAIHGNNPELIHLLEENNVKQFDDGFNLCFIESIKCFHNDLANYFDVNYSIIKNCCCFDEFLKYRSYSYLSENDFNSDNLYKLVLNDCICFIKEFVKDYDMNKVHNIL